jgi:hypothetical protein
VKRKTPPPTKKRLRPRQRKSAQFAPPPDEARRPFPLDDRRDAFARAYVATHNATQAAIDAGYSNHRPTAQVTGCRMLSDAKVQTRIAELELVATHRAEHTAERVLEELGYPPTRICQARLDAVGVPDNVVAVRQLVLWALPLIDPRGFEREPVGVALDSAQVDEIRFYLLLLSGALAGLCESEAARVEARRLLQSARGGVLDELAIRRLLKEDSQAILSSAGPLSEPVAYRFLDPAARVRLLRHKLLVRHRERSSHE